VPYDYAMRARPRYWGGQGPAGRFFPGV